MHTHVARRQEFREIFICTMKHSIKQTELSNTSIFSFVQNIKITGYHLKVMAYL